MEERTIEDKLCPETLPIFPLVGALLLPGGRLPLHVFEPRYRAMVEDALAGDGFIGMIQPYATGPVSYDEDEPDGDEDEAEAEGGGAASAEPELFTVGCAGVIERWERLPDGRFIILLKGMARFRIREELEPVRGYRTISFEKLERYRKRFDDAAIVFSAPAAQSAMQSAQR